MRRGTTAPNVMQLREISQSECIHMLMTEGAADIIDKFDMLPSEDDFVAPFRVRDSASDICE